MKTGTRTIGYLRKGGIICQSVEQYNSYTHRFYDLFNFIDIIALVPERGIVAVQACGQDFQSHVRKICQEHAEEARHWLGCGGLIDIYGWRKLKVKVGGKAVRWTPRILEITMNDLELNETSV